MQIHDFIDIERLKSNNVVLYEMLTQLIDAYQDGKPDVIEQIIFDFTTGITKVYPNDDSN